MQTWWGVKMKMPQVQIFHNLSFLSLVYQMLNREMKPKAESCSSVQFSSVTQLCPTLCDPMDCSTPGFTPGFPVHLQFPELTQNHVHQVVIPSNHRILCGPLLLLSSIFASTRVFSNESALCIRWPKYWSFSFSISPSNEYSGLISFRSDWFHLLAVQETLKSLLQYHSSKASILQCSAFFIVQLSHPYMTTGKTISLILSSVAQLCPNLCDPMNRSIPGLPVHYQFLEFTQTHVHWVSDAIQPSHPLLFPFPPTLNLSQHQGLFKWVSSSHQVAKGLELQLQHQSFQRTPRLISFRMDWLDLLAVQGTLKSLLQHHNSKASILRHSVFFFFF